MNQSITLRKVAIFFLIFAVVFHIVVYSSYFIIGTLFLDDLAYSELSWIQLTGTYPHLAYLISEYLRMMGIVVLILEMFVLYATYLMFWKGSKGGWVLAMIGSAVPLIMELALTFPVIGFSIPYMAYIMLTIMITLGLIIAGKELFGRKKATTDSGPGKK